MTVETTQQVPTVPDEQWQRFSRLTPVARILALWSGAAVTAFYLARDWVPDGGMDMVQRYVAALGWMLLGYVLIGMVAVSAVSAVAAIWIWRSTEFAVTSEGIHMRKGVFIRNRSHLRWDRIQSIEMQCRFFPRLMRRAELRVETANGVTGEDLVLGYLSSSDCLALRDSLLNAANAARDGLPVVLAPWRGVHVEAKGSESAVYSQPNRRLVASQIVSWKFAVGVLGVAGSVAGMYVDISEGGKSWWTIGLILVLLKAIQEALTAVGGRWGTEVRLTREGVHCTYGAFSVMNENVLPGRITAIEVKQPFLWRRRGWWSLSVATLGDSLTLQVMSSSVLVPAGTREDVTRVLKLLVADLGVEDPDALVAEAFNGEGDGVYFANASHRARKLDPFGWARNAYAVTDTVAVFRSGKVLARRIILSPLARFQGIVVKQGPLQKACGLGSAHAAIPFAEIEPKIRNLEVEACAALHDRLCEAGRAARARGDRESIEEWRVRVGVAEA